MKISLLIFVESGLGILKGEKEVDNIVERVENVQKIRRELSEFFNDLGNNTCIKIVPICQNCNEKFQLENG